MGRHVAGERDGEPVAAEDRALRERDGDAAVRAVVGRGQEVAGGGLLEEVLEPALDLEVERRRRPGDRAEHGLRELRPAQLGERFAEQIHREARRREPEGLLVARVEEVGDQDGGGHLVVDLQADATAGEQVRIELHVRDGRAGAVHQQARVLAPGEIERVGVDDPVVPQLLVRVEADPVGGRVVELVGERRSGSVN